MKNPIVCLVTAALLGALPSLALAHDPAEHAREAAQAGAAADCRRLDRRPMKAGDPVASALSVRCGTTPHTEHSTPAATPAASASPAASHAGHGDH